MGSSYNHNGRYGEYYPVTAIGRIIAVFIMFSGIGIGVTVLSLISQRRLQKAEARLRSMIEVQPEVQPTLGDNMKIIVKNKIEVIETITDEDFDALLVMIKGLRRTLLEGSITSYRCTRCGNVYHSKPKFCSNCGLDLS